MATANAGTEVILGKNSTGVKIPESLQASAEVKLKRLLALAVSGNAETAPKEAELVAAVTAEYAEWGLVLPAGIAQVLVDADMAAARKDIEIARLKAAAKGKGASKSAGLAKYKTLKEVTAYLLSEKGLGNMEYRAVVEARQGDGEWTSIRTFVQKMQGLGTKKDDKTGETMKYAGVNVQESVVLECADKNAVGASVFFALRLHLPQQTERWA